MTNDKREQARVLREDVDASVRAAANMLPAQMGKELAAVEAGAAALMREAEADTAPDVSDADGWYKKFTSWFGVNEYNKICHLLALKERPDCITEVAEYVFENAFSEYIAALRAARKREGEAVAENERLRKALRIFRGCAYPVSTEINPRGHDWRGEESLDYALSECEAALNEGAKTMTLFQLKDIINENFCEPFCEKGLVEAKCKPADEGFRLHLRIAGRDVEIDKDGKVVGAGTSACWGHDDNDDYVPREAQP